MEKPVATFGKGATCSSWNYCGQRLASGSVDGVLAIYDAVSSSSASVTSKVSEYSIDKVVWVPPEFGQGVACIFADGSVAIWEETAQDGQVLKWMQCAQFSRPSTKVLDLCFGVFGTRLKLVTAYSDGFVRVYELLDPLELSSWQLQAEFLNVADSVTNFDKAKCLSSSISWNPSRDESRPSSFVVGFNSDVFQLNSAKVWEFDDAHHRWLSLFLSSTLSSSMEPAIAAAGEEHCFPRKPRILLAASGSVAAIKFSNLCRCFSEWAEVRAVATKSSLHFIDTNFLPDDIVFYTDEDEWSSWKKIGDTVLHIELRRWADILVIAPLSANTLAKIAGGLCDNLLTCIVRAWDYGKPVFVAPAMNTFMWTNPFTKRHLMAIDELGVSLIPPVTKRLACGDYGNGAMAEPSLIYSTVRLFAEHHSKSNNNH